MRKKVKKNQRKSERNLSEGKNTKFVKGCKINNVVKRSTQNGNSITTYAQAQHVERRNATERNVRRKNKKKKERNNNKKEKKKYLRRSSYPHIRKKHIYICKCKYLV